MSTTASATLADALEEVVARRGGQRAVRDLECSVSFTWRELGRTKIAARLGATIEALHEAAP